MAKSLAGTRTEKNLAAAFAGESMARNRYTFFASAAKSEGFESIAAIFHETADNEKEHAKTFLHFLAGGSPTVQIQLAIPSFTIGTTLENVKFAASGEHEERATAYPGFATVAQQEGFTAITDAFKAIALVEAAHERRFTVLIRQVETGTVFKRDHAVSWKCRNCGYIHNGREAPVKCPACWHAQSFYELPEVLE
jgi:rubrerythrin